MSTYIFTFYSFKGGVGRTMAMLNVGYCLASWGRNVLMLDMDLEAPGLSEFIAKEDPVREAKPNDIVDVVAWARKRAAAEDWDNSEAILSTRPAWDQTVVNLMDANSAPDVLKPKLGEAGCLDVIGAHAERDYLSRLTALRLGELADDAETLDRVSNLVRACVKSYRFPIGVPDHWGPDAPREAAYDYILVDSRTGLTEIGGLCVGPLADRLVVLTSLNEQNIEGTRSFLETIGIKLVSPIEKPWDEADPEQREGVPHRLGPKPTLIVTSPVPYGEIAYKQARHQRVRERLGPPIGWLSYHPQMALSESVFVRDYRGEYLAEEYRGLAEAATVAVRDHPTQLAALFQKHWAEDAGKGRAVIDVLRLAPQDPGVGDVILKQLIKSFEPETDKDFRIADRVYTFLASPGARPDAAVLGGHGCLLGKWIQKTPDEPLCRARCAAAISRFDALLQRTGASAEQRAMALIGRGVAKAKTGDADNAVADYAAALAIPDAPAARRTEALLHRAVARGQQGDNAGALSDYAMVLDAADASDEQKVQAHGSTGWAMYSDGRYEDAAEHARRALGLAADEHWIRANLGLALLHLGETQEGLREYGQAIAGITDADELDQQVGKDLREAMVKQPDLPGGNKVLKMLAGRQRELRAGEE